MTLFEYVLETFFINLTRGTGIKGLLGIKPVVGKVVRPLLIYSRTQIEDYLFNLNQEFRTDSTNSSEKYLRLYFNKINFL